MSSWLRKLNFLREKYRPVFPTSPAPPFINYVQNLTSHVPQTQGGASGTWLEVLYAIISILAISAGLTCVITCLCGEYLQWIF